MYDLMRRLYPICRSITGNGVRETLQIIQEKVALTVHEVPSGTPVLDWNVPKEWNIRDAYLIAPDGTKIADFQAHNLHVVSYSVPVRQRMSLEALRPHLHTLPDQPDIIPYRTSYYNENWGFCLTHHQFETLPDGEYEVVIDSTLEDGALTYGECVIPGASTDEVLITCYLCHPSMCNDNLSGVVLAAQLAQVLQEMQAAGEALRYTYRLLFIPETIGAITWLAQNRDQVAHIKHGIVATCLGDPGRLTYKKTRAGEAELDHTVMHVLAHSGFDHAVLDFYPLGSDERQFSSPGFNLPVGSIMRTPYGRFSQYHTSADDLALVQPEYLGETFEMYAQVVAVLEGNRTYRNTHPYGEPQLGRRGLYRTVGGAQQIASLQEAIMWVLNFSDGTHSLLAIAERANLPFATIRAAADALLAQALLVEDTTDSSF